MTAQMSQEMRASGIAKVIVILKKSPAKADNDQIRSNVEKHFVKSELSQLTALAASAVYRGVEPPTVRYYPNLGVMLGTVNPNGLAGLRAEKDVVAEITGAPPLSLIRPLRAAGAPSTPTRPPHRRRFRRKHHRDLASSFH